MSVGRMIAAAVTVAGLTLGTAGPAWAQPTLSGHYTETEIGPGGPSTTNDWYFTPCGDGCASAVVNGTPEGQAKLVDGQWNIDTVGATTCADGTHFDNAISTHRAWDANTLAGTAQETLNVAACGQPVGYSYTNNIQLRQVP
jgi:hypothetical protein